MSDSINTSIDNFSANYEALVLANLGTQVQGPAKIKDTAAVSQSDNENKFVYTPPGTPKLPMPGENADPMGMSNLGDMLQNFLGDVLAASNMVPTPDTSFVDEAEEQIGGLSDEFVKDLNTGLPSDKTVKMIRYSVFNPEADMPESIKNAADTIREKTIAATGQEPSSFVAILNNKSAEMGYSALLKAEIMKLGLSAEDQQKLLAAHDMPGFVAKLSPEMQKMLAGAEKAAFAGVQADIGIPNNWKVPRSGEDYKTGVADAYEMKIGDKLYEKYMNGDISKAAYNDLRTLLYVPGSSPPNAAALTLVLNQIKGESLKEVQSSWGFPSDYQPTISANDYTAILTGTFYASASKAIGAQTPPLSSADQALLKKALSSPAAKESLPANLKQILSNIEAGAVAKVVKQYGLPDNWQPDAVMLGNAERLNTPKLQFAQAALSFAQEYTSKVTEIAKIQVGAAKGVEAGVTVHKSTGSQILNYLKIVSQALSSLQEALSAASIAESNLSKLLTRIETDASLGKLAKQKKELEDVKAKQAKMAAMGPFKIIFMIIMMVILTMLMGPAGFMLVMALIVNSAVQEKGDLSKMDLFSDFAKTMTQLGTAIGGPSFGKAFAAIANILLIIEAPALLLCDLMFGEGSSIKNILKGFGVPDAVAGYITMAIQVAFMIVTIIVMCVFAPELVLAEVAALVSTVTAKVATMVPKVLITAFNFVIQALDKARASSEAVNAILNIVRQAISKVKNFIRSDYISTKSSINAAKEAKVALNNAQEGLSAAKANLATVRSAGKSVKEVRQAEVALKKAEESVKFQQKAYDMADQVAAQAKVVKSNIKTAEDAIETAVDKLRSAKASGQGVQQAKADLKAAQQALTKAEDEALESYTHLTSRVLDEAGKAGDIAQAQFKAAETATKTAKSAYKDAKAVLEGYQEIQQNAIKSGDVALQRSTASMIQRQESAVNTLSNTYKAAKDAERVANHSMSLAEGALSAAADKAMKPLQDFATVTDMVTNTIQGSMQVNNNIIQAQLAILKGDLDAYIVNVEAFIAILKQLISKLLQSLKDLGRDLANLGQVMQDNWAKQTQAMTTLSQAM